MSCPRPPKLCCNASAANEADDDEDGGDGNGVSNSEALSGLSVSLECPQVGMAQLVTVMTRGAIQ